jgi:hypothetical protein
MIAVETVIGHNDYGGVVTGQLKQPFQHHVVEPINAVHNFPKKLEPAILC